jgi:hypothetical protein
MYDFTCEVATLEPPSPRLQELLVAIRGDQLAMDDFVRVNAGLLSPAVFFAEDNVRRILAGARPLSGGAEARP